MSAVVKDLSMVDRCRKCLLNDLNWDRCYGLQGCPIIAELPDTHGRLVDVNEVKERLLRFGFSAPDMTITEFIKDELTTIVEAEVSE